MRTGSEWSIKTALADPNSTGHPAVYLSERTRLMDMNKIAAEEALFHACCEALVDQMRSIDETECGDGLTAGWYLQLAPTGISLRQEADVEGQPRTLLVRLPQNLHVWNLAQALSSSTGCMAISYVIVMFGQFPAGMPRQYRDEIRKAAEAVVSHAVKLQHDEENAEFGRKSATRH